MKTHNLKIHPNFFEAVKCGDKLFELRKNDRDYSEGDWIILGEYEPAEIMTGQPGYYTGRVVRRRISYLLHFKDQADFGAMNEGYVVIGIQPDISDLGFKLQGHNVYIGTTDMAATAEATKYMIDLHKLVERLKEERDDRDERARAENEQRDFYDAERRDEDRGAAE